MVLARATGYLRARGRWLALALVAAVCVMALVDLVTTDQPFLPLDDAYITLHNAKTMLSLAEDPVFDSVDPAAGATSPAHLTLVAALLLLLPGAWASLVAAWLAVLALVLGLLRLGRVHHRLGGQTVLLVIVGCCCGLMPLHLFNGLETGLALAGLSWALALADEDREAPNQPVVALPLLCGTLPFLRPELGLVSALLLLVELRRAWSGGGRRQLAWVGGLALAGALPWIVVCCLQGPGPLPSTIGAKLHYFAEGCLSLAKRIDITFENLLIFCRSTGPLCLGLFPLAFCTAGRAGLLLVLALPLAYGALFPGALGHYNLRYLYLLVPALLFGLSWLAAPARPRPLRLIGTLLLLATAANSLWTVRSALEIRRRNQSFTRVELQELSRWCRTHLPRSSRLLVHDIGYLGHVGDFPLIDLVGLKCPPAAALHRRLTGPSCGHLRGEAVHRLALKRRPTHLVVLPGWEEIYFIATGLALRGWRLEQLRPPPWVRLPQPKPPSLYTVYRLTPPAARSRPVVTITPWWR